MDAMSWSILLLLLGLVLVVLELFVPSGGSLGVLAAVSLVASIGLGFSASLFQGLVMLLLVLATTPGAVFVAFKVWPYTPLGRVILNRHAVDTDQTPIDERIELVGRVGVSKSKMLPSGAILVDGRTYNAVSMGMPIEANMPIRVVKLDGNSIVVQPHDGRIDPNQAGAETVLEQPLDSIGLDPFDDPLA